MSDLSHQDAFSQLGSRMPKEQTEVGDSIDPPSDQFAEVANEQWQAEVRSLQGCICELLIKNLELRMTVMAMKARELEDGGGQRG